MKVSRRQVITTLPVALALAACAPVEESAAPRGEGARSVVNVRDFGALGDGATDDSSAIQAAVAALRPRSILRFPKGSYRFAQQYPPGTAAVAITGISQIDIEFEPDAELVMDNLDPQTGMGTSHGVFVRGPATAIALRNVKIRWATQPPRSLGDGIRILGYPTDHAAPLAGWDGPPAPVSDVHISDCQILFSPQAGAILLGVSDSVVAGLRVQQSSADGLHFNACRRGNVTGLTAVDNGDDGLALVTEFSEVPSFHRAEQTFSFPALTEWSNTDFTIVNVNVAGGRANGVRFGGTNRAELRALTVTRKHTGAGVIVDSAAVVGPDSAWRYVASQGLRLTQIAVDNCEMGIQVLARPSGIVDPRFTDFGIDIADATLRDCSNWSVRAESLTEQRMTGLRIDACTVGAQSMTGGNGGIGLGRTQGVQLGDISLTHAQPVIAFSAVGTGQLAVNRLQLITTEPGDPDTAPLPCALFENSDGVLNEVDVRWPHAPATWTPIRVTTARDPNDPIVCDDPSVPPPVAFRTLTVDPSFVLKRVGDC